MTTVLVDPELTDDQRRERMFHGDLVVYSAVPEVAAFVAHARAML